MRTAYNMVCFTNFENIANIATYLFQKVGPISRFNLMSLDKSFFNPIKTGRHVGFACGLIILGFCYAALAL